MNSLMLISKVGGYEAASRILNQLTFEAKASGGFIDFTVTLDNGFSFQASELYKAWSNRRFDYWDGIVIGTFGGSGRIILSNAYGYLGKYWGYKSFRPCELKTVWDLEQLKSDAINHGARMDWETYQWVLNNFDWLRGDHEA